MAISVDMLKSLVPITQFNKGQAAQVFDRLKSERQLVVLKNNVPAAVVLSTSEYARLAEIEENYYLLLMAQERLAQSNPADALSEGEVMKNLGISPEDVAAAEDVDIE